MRVHNPNGTSIGSVIFAQMTAACLLYNVLPFSPVKIALPMLASGPHVIAYVVHWAHPSPERKWQLDRFSRFAGLTSVTD